MPRTSRNARSVRTMSATVITGKSDPYGRPGRRIDRGRAGRAAATTEQVGRHDEVAIGVEGLARADHPVPPAQALAGTSRRGRRRRTRRACSPRRGCPREAGRVGVAAEGVADQDDVVALRRQGAVGLVGHPDGMQRPSAIELHRARADRGSAFRRFRSSRPRTSRLAHASEHSQSACRAPVLSSLYDEESRELGERGINGP